MAGKMCSHVLNLCTIHSIDIKPILHHGPCTAHSDVKWASSVDGIHGRGGLYY